MSSIESTGTFPKIVAHRGESSVAPENTVPSYELAWKNGRCWAVETDVYLTTDNVLICCHDKTTLRTTGTDWLIETKSFPELRSLDAGSWKHPMWYGVKLPSLQEVFKTIPPHGHIFVEIKSAGPQFAKAYEEARLAGGVSNDQVTIISFVAEELKHVRELLPDVRTLLLLTATPADAEGRRFFPTADEAIRQARALDVTGFDLDQRFIPDAAYVQQLHDAGFEVHVWTVDTLEDAQKMTSFKVDSITTNRSKALFEELHTK